MTVRGPNPTVFLLMFVFVLLAGSGAAYWQYTNYRENAARVEKLRNELESSADLERQAQVAKQRVMDALQQIEHLETTVSTIEYVPTLLKDLQHTAEACNLRVTGVRPAPPKPEKKGKKGESEKKSAKPYEEIDVEVKVLGGFESTMTFLRKLEEFPKIVSVQYVSVDPRVDTRTRVLTAIETTFNIRVYAFPTVPTAPKAEAKSETVINLSPESRGLNQNMEEAN
jgi:Tfp pilus assembly protein PilO